MAYYKCLNEVFVCVGKLNYCVHFIKATTVSCIISDSYRLELF